MSSLFESRRVAVGHVRGYPACGSGEPSRRKFITRLRSTGGMDIDKQEEGERKRRRGRRKERVFLSRKKVPHVQCITYLFKELKVKFKVRYAGN